MPIYEYRCDKCENIFEVLTTSGSQEDTVLCSKCGSDRVSKLISAGSIRRGAGTVLPSGPSAGSPGCGHRGFS